MKSKRRTPTADLLAGSKIPTIFEATVYNGGLARPISKLKKYILGKTVPVSQNDKRKNPVYCFVCCDNTR